MKKIILLFVSLMISLALAHPFPPTAQAPFEAPLPTWRSPKAIREIAPTANDTAHRENPNRVDQVNDIATVATQRRNDDLLFGIMPEISANGAGFTYHLPVPQEISAAQIFVQFWRGEVYAYVIEGTADGENWQIVADARDNQQTATAAGWTHNFPPQIFKSVRVNFLGKLPKGAALKKLQLFAQPPAAEIIGIFGDRHRRYLPNESLIVAADNNEPPTLNLTAWRGERVNAQIILQTPMDGKTLRVLRINPLRKLPSPNNADVKSATRISTTYYANFVRNVLASPKLADDLTDGELARFPDIIENSLTEVPTVAGETRTLWITIDIAPDAVAGEYVSSIVVGENDTTNAKQFLINLTVLNAALPAPANWRVALDLWQTPEAVAHAHNVDLWSDEHFAIMLPHYRRLANAGQKNITATIIHEAWAHQAYYAQPGMVRWIKNANGEMEYDFSIFDKWVEFMSEQVGINGKIVCYTMLPWSLAFRYFENEQAIDVKLQPDSLEYEKLWGDFLTAFVKHLREKNWLARTCIGMDERPDKLMLSAIAILKKYAPELRMVSAVKKATDKNQEIAELSPIMSQIDASKSSIENRRAAGLTTTYYVCVNHIRPNTFTFSPLAQAEWLGNYAAANRLDGFLRWAYDNFNEAPLICTDYTDFAHNYPSGDCFLVYPGARSSLRFERLRDGLENFEKIAILRDAAVAQNKPEVIAPLENFLQSTYTWERGQRADNPYAADNEQTEKLINTAAKILFP